MAVTGAVMVLLAIVAWRDVATRTIPDVISLTLLIVGLGARLPHGWSAVAASAAAAVVVFCVMIPLHSRGLLGGGDVKLLASLAFGLSPGASYQMISAVVMAGGILALTYLALRRILKTRGTARHWTPRRRSTAHRVMAVELWRIRKGAPLPYGLAIAAGASLVIGHQGA